MTLTSIALLPLQAVGLGGFSLAVLSLAFWLRFDAPIWGWLI